MPNNLIAIKEITNGELFFCIYESEIGEKFDLKTSALSILIGLSRYYDYKIRIVSPSIETMASHLNISEKTVRTSINELVNKGLILKTQQGTHNVYCFTNLFWNCIKEVSHLLLEQEK